MIRAAAANLCPMPPPLLGRDDDAAHDNETMWIQVDDDDDAGVHCVPDKCRPLGRRCVHLTR